MGVSAGAILGHITPRKRGDAAEENQLKCPQALRAGGFVCLLPNVINPAWGGHAIRLVGFPITICFTGLSPKSEQDCRFQ